MPTHAAERSLTWDEWLSDLAGYRRTFRGTGFVWDQDTVLETIDWATEGQREFCSLVDVSRLDEARVLLTEVDLGTRLALAAPVERALTEATVDDVAAVIQLPVRAVRRILREAEHTPPHLCTSSLAERAAAGRGSNPLIIGWEVRQAADLAAAARCIVEETLDILLWELRTDYGIPPFELCDYAYVLTAAQIRHRIERRERLIRRYPPGRFDPRTPAPVSSQRLEGQAALSPIATPDEGPSASLHLVR